MRLKFTAAVAYLAGRRCKAGQECLSGPNRTRFRRTTRHRDRFPLKRGIGGG